MISKLFPKYRLVKFADGSYGVRERWSLFWFGHRFVDISTPRHSWSIGDYFWSDCRGTEEQARAVLKAKMTPYEVVE